MPPSLALMNTLAIIGMFNPISPIFNATSRLRGKAKPPKANPTIKRKRKAKRNARKLNRK